MILLAHAQTVMKDAEEYQPFTVLYVFLESESSEQQRIHSCSGHERTMSTVVPTTVADDLHGGTLEIIWRTTVLIIVAQVVVLLKVPKTRMKAKHSLHNCIAQ